MPFTEKPRKWYQKAWSFWVSNPPLDWPILITAAATTFVLVRYGPLTDPLGRMSGDRRGGWYQTLAGVAGAFLGFGITPLAIVLALAPGPRLQAFFRRFGTPLVQAFLAAVRSLMLVTAMAGVAYVGDTTATDHYLWRCLTHAALFLAVLRVVRLILVFSQLLLANAEDSKMTLSNPAPNEDRRRFG